jgi:hypothetical protein
MGPYYRLFGTLLILTPRHNNLLPSDTMMRNALENFGMEVVRILYRYLDMPDGRPWRDHLLRFLGCSGVLRRFAFWRNTMEVYARKPGLIFHE